MMLYRASRNLCISFLAILITLAICILGRPLMAQNQTNVQTQASPIQVTNHQDNWRHTPVPANAHPDTLSPEARQARDKIWERASPPPLPNGRDSALALPGVGSNYGEIYTEPDAIWIVASFIDFDVHRAPNGSIYTEIHLRIDKNVGPIHPGTPPVGTTVDLGIPGGSVMLDDGSVHESHTKNYIDYVRPGHKYLLCLHEAGVSEPDFYVNAEGWDVSDGIAHSVFTREVAIAKHGRSSVEELSEADAIQRIERLLSEKAGK
jgi:hypothetical protein